MASICFGLISWLCFRTYMAKSSSDEEMDGGDYQSPRLVSTSTEMPRSPTACALSWTSCSGVIILSSSNGECSDKSYNCFLGLGLVVAIWTPCRRGIQCSLLSPLPMVVPFLPSHPLEIGHRRMTCSFVNSQHLSLDLSQKLSSGRLLRKTVASQSKDLRLFLSNRFNHLITIFRAWIMNQRMPSLHSTKKVETSFPSEVPNLPPAPDQEPHACSPLEHARDPRPPAPLRLQAWIFASMSPRMPSTSFC